MGLHAPAHHHAAVQVDHGCQIHPALISLNVGDVCRPHLVGLLGAEVARQQIVSNGQLVFAVGGDDELSLASGANALALHEFSDPLFAYFEPSGQQLFVDFGPAVFAFDLEVNGPDMGEQSGFVYPKSGS